MSLLKNIICVLILFVSLVFSAQEIPPIQVFTPQEYGAEDQNWSISQSKDDFIYVANNKGLLEYNGASWMLYSSPNDGILRSVRVLDDRIYSGGYMDFGYWTKNEQGKLLYTSLVDNREFTIKEDEEFWGIIDIEGYILFQSFESIYIYNTTDDSFDIIVSDSRINKMFKVDETIYFQETEKGIFKIENGKQTLVISSDLIDDKDLINIYNSDLGLLLQTRNSGFYNFINGALEVWSINSEFKLSNLSIYSSTRLKDGSFILGTIANGIFHIDKNGNELLKINQAYGLSNNTVLSILEDSHGNIWLGLDNGINVINLNSPYKVYTDKQGALGTVYAAAKSLDYLYLGTNQGLFYKRIDSKGKFKFVQGTQGQIWYLEYIKGTLFCGHDIGTFIVDKDIVEQISYDRGSWALKEIKGKPNLLIQGIYKGLNILEKVNDKWQYRNKIEGFDMSSRYFEFIDSNKILISHEYKGVYKVAIDDAFTKVQNYKKLPLEEGVKSSILTYNDSVLYSHKAGVFRFDNISESFRKDSVLSSLFSGENYISGKLIYDEEQNRLWGFTKNEIIYVEPGKLSNEPKSNAIEIPNEIRKTKSGFEDVLRINDDSYLIGNTEGYIIIDLSKIKPVSNKIYLNEVSFTSLHNNKFESVSTSEPIILENRNNSIQFRFSVPNFDKFSTLKYQYRLAGIYDNWGDWTTDSDVLFENLPFGDYEFEARAKTSGIVSSNVLLYKFSIEKPWYLKPLALTLYALIALSIIFLLHYFNKRHYKKQQHKLIVKKERELELEQFESQRQIMEFKNKNLRQDIDNKNRELGMATMNLVKRNELLNNIKVELTKSKSLNEVKVVIKLINSSLNNTSDWKLFEEAFNNVDKDFMKRIKSLHPSITPNDLRLCAYLRLNLSSKEIAPLLNISHKSVEVKRYRLRKKIGLDHEQSLSNYIIEL